MAELTADQRQLVDLVTAHGRDWLAVGAALGISNDAARQRFNRLPEELRASAAAPSQTREEGLQLNASADSDTATLVSVSRRIRTVEDALAYAEVDLATWDVERYTINKWEQASRGDDGGTQVVELWQIKVYLRRRPVEVRALDELLERLAAWGPVVPPRKYPRLRQGENRRCLEIGLADPHLGLRCFPPAADEAWSLELCAEVAMGVVEHLLEQAQLYAPVEQIVFPFGHDWLHSDTHNHTTTAGTLQPESDSWHHAYVKGEELAIAIVARLAQVAPVYVYQIPGNHDRLSNFTLGRVLAAYFRRDANVTVDASASPYKFHRFGKVLLGMEHGHSLKPHQFAGVMANERPQDWAETTWREWHLGDQHRKGIGKAVAFEEQGVGCEYLPCLTASNEWHRLKGFNHNTRGAVAFVWDAERGPVARLSCSLAPFLEAATA